MSDSRQSEVHHDSAITDPQRAARAARISAAEVTTEHVERYRRELQRWLKARDRAFWEAQREGVEVRLLASLTGLTTAAVYQAIERAKLREDPQS